MHAFLVEFLILGTTLLILNASLGEKLRRDLWTDERGFGNEEDNADAKDAEQDGADAERPLVTEIFDDVAADEPSACDTTEEEEIPYGNAGGTFVNKVSADMMSENTRRGRSGSAYRSEMVACTSTSYGAIPSAPKTRLPKKLLYVSATLPQMLTTSRMIEQRT
jgi:hypothetical protein